MLFENFHVNCIARKSISQVSFCVCRLNDLYDQKSVFADLVPVSLHASSDQFLSLLSGSRTDL